MAIRLLAHRGLWTIKSEQNTLEAFVAALDAGHGIETDLRDQDGQLVISHDPPRSSADAPSARDLFRALQTHPQFHRALWALNIKSDGLEPLVKALIQEFDLHENSFVFDMSGPSHYKFTQHLPAHNIGARVSEFEPPLLLDQSQYLWVDQFKHFAFELSTLRDWQSQGKILCFVSPDLHGRPTDEFWAWLREHFGPNAPQGSPPDVYLCTDQLNAPF